MSSKKRLGAMGWLMQAQDRCVPLRVATALSTLGGGQRLLQDVRGGKKVGEETRT